MCKYAIISDHPRSIMKSRTKKIFTILEGFSLSCGTINVSMSYIDFGSRYYIQRNFQIPFTQKVQMSRSAPRHLYFLRKGDLKIPLYIISGSKIDIWHRYIDCSTGQAETFQNGEYLFGPTFHDGARVIGNYCIFAHFLGTKMCHEWPDDALVWCSGLINVA